MRELVETALECAVESGRRILKIWENPELWQVSTKSDDSPLTRADRESHAFITEYLESKTGFPVLSEENVRKGRESWDELWIVDPLDGTKEFIKKIPEFTVNIAFVRHGRPVFGVICAPAKRKVWYSSADGVFIYDVRFSRSTRLEPRRWDGKTLRIAGSRFHSNEKFDLFVKMMKETFPALDIKVDVTGSALKFCKVAEGEIQVYPRFGKTYEWDVCAGDAIVKRAGGKITDLNGKPLSYNKSELTNPFFIAFSKDFPLEREVFNVALKVVEQL